MFLRFVWSDNDLKPIVNLNLSVIARSVEKMITFAMFVVFTLFAKEPRTFAEALKRDDKDKWIAATNAERDALEEAGTWKITNLPPGAFCIPSTIVYKIKQDAQGRIDKYKARLCARGDLQVEGLHYGNTYSPVVRFATIRLVVAIATIMN